MRILRIFFVVFFSFIFIRRRQVPKLPHPQSPQPELLLTIGEMNRRQTTLNWLSDRPTAYCKHKTNKMRLNKCLSTSTYNIPTNRYAERLLHRKCLSAVTDGRICIIRLRDQLGITICTIHFHSNFPPSSSSVTQTQSQSTHRTNEGIILKINFKRAFICILKIAFEGKLEINSKPIKWCNAAWIWIKSWINWKLGIIDCLSVHIRLQSKYKFVIKCIFWSKCYKS